MPPLPGTEPRLADVHAVPPVVYVEASYEYRLVSRELGSGTAPLAEAELNELGQAGWELVSVLDDGRSAHFYFKRTAR